MTHFSFTWPKMLRITNGFVVFAAAGWATAALAAALVAQHGFGLHPCELCMFQRYPYAALCALGMAGWLLRGREKWLKTLAYAALALLVAEVVIATYHAGVEQHIFPGFTSCTAGSGGEKTLEQMRAEIMAAPLVACDQPMGEFMDISMAGWNALLTFAFTIALSATFRGQKK